MAYLGPQCLSKRLLKHFNRRQNQTTFVVGNIDFCFFFQGICDIHSCVDLTPGNNYGHMVNFNPNAFGAYCGEGKMCMAGNCKVMADSHLPASALTVVAGGWSAWGSFTSK